MLCIQDAVYGKGNDDEVKVKPAASRKRKTADEEQESKEQAAAIDFKVRKATGWAAIAVNAQVSGVLKQRPCSLHSCLPLLCWGCCYCWEIVKS